MRAYSPLLILLALDACTNTSRSGTGADEHPVVSDPALVPSDPTLVPRDPTLVPSDPTFVLEQRLCVPEAWTIGLPADRHAPVSEPVGACKNYVNEAAMEANPISCGPCGFTFDPVVTRSARARASDACCYTVSSPPPPELTVPSTDPRFACASNGDCIASCQHGAVSRVWHEATYPNGEACEDGCTSKGTEPPMCVDGGCVARRAGADDPLCTRLERPTLEPPIEPPIAAPTTGAPLVVGPGGGFVQVEESGDGKAGHSRHSSPPGSACMVDIRWWRPMPPDPGQPMVEATRRPVTIDGTKTDVITTSMFEGHAKEVDAVFLRGESYQIRIVFEKCGSLEEDGFLAAIRIND